MQALTFRVISFQLRIKMHTQDH